MGERLAVLAAALAACGRFGYQTPLPDGGSTAADGPLVDAVPFTDASPRDGPPTATICVGGACACPPAGDCAFVCEPGVSCALECGRNSTCSLDCAGQCGGGCGIACLAGASCYLDCTGTGDPCSAMPGGSLTMQCNDTCGCTIQ